MSDLISRADAISVLDNFTQTDALGHTPRQIVEALPSAQPYTEADIQKMQDLEQAELLKAYECGMASAQPEWNNHTVACLLAELFDDKCDCNYNGIDEWLPEKCEVIDACPNPVGVACWEQYLAWKPCPEPYREDGAE